MLNVNLPYDTEIAGSIHGAVPATKPLHICTFTNVELKDICTLLLSFFTLKLSFFKDVLFDNLWWISGITNSREYVLTVENEAGDISTCNVHIEVKAETGDDDDDQTKANGNDDATINNSEEEHEDKIGDEGDDDSDKDNKFDKYKGSVNKAIYKEVKGWKKHDKQKYYEYQTAYRKYRDLSNDERADLVQGEEYAKYKKYKIYKKYKEYRKIEKSN